MYANQQDQQNRALVYVVEQQGSTSVFPTSPAAESFYQYEREVALAVNLVMYTALAPISLLDDPYGLAEWCLANAEPIDFIHEVAR